MKYNCWPVSGDGVAEQLSRVKRSAFSPARIAQKRNIEILVVADDTMVKNYGTEEATTYILTVMNMVGLGGQGWLSS